MVKFFAEYNFEVKYKKIGSNVAADYMSRIIHGEEGQEREDEGRFFGCYDRRE